MMSKDTMVYLHKNPVTYEVFYVGIGIKKRATRRSQRSEYWNRYVNKYGLPIIEIIYENIDWEEAVKIEIDLISKYKRTCDGGTLVNLTLGGEGSKGKFHSEETKEKLRIINTGKIASDETRRKMSLSRIGKVQSEETIRKRSFKLIGKIKSEENKQKLREGRLGTKASDETRLKMSIGRRGELNGNYGKKMSEKNKQNLRLLKLGTKFSDEAKMKMSKSRTGLKRSEATKEKMRISAKNRKDRQL